MFHFSVFDLVLKNIGQWEGLSHISWRITFILTQPTRRCKKTMENHQFDHFFKANLKHMSYHWHISPCLRGSVHTRSQLIGLQTSSHPELRAKLPILQFFFFVLLVNWTFWLTSIGTPFPEKPSLVESPVFFDTPNPVVYRWVIPHYPWRIHGAGIYANIRGILMVNITIYSIHGSDGLWSFHRSTNR